MAFAMGSGCMKLTDAPPLDAIDQQFG